MTGKMPLDPTQLSYYQSLANHFHFMGLKYFSSGSGNTLYQSAYAYKPELLDTACIDTFGQKITQDVLDLFGMPDFRFYALAGWVDKRFDGPPKNVLFSHFIINSNLSYYCGHKNYAGKG